MMNHTTLALAAVLAAAALVIGTFATTTIVAFADSSKTVVKQKNKQKAYQGGIINSADQDATNVICINTRPCIVG